MWLCVASWSSLPSWPSSWLPKSRNPLTASGFFKEDPLGKDIVEQLGDLVSIVGQMRQRFRYLLANYLKNLEE
ncbi:hypothetical protein SprV_0702288600 [Sparganum proliferum]